ncbi:peptidase inhibitor family I36 protein [Nonomuraea sp. NPDC046802]|uniref:peptidase inhibitor family I36 protein n=1 Tax=Nonomuraea sp. NPDC046802 TaxID=3154919 RepID=UPI0033C44AE0
MDAGGITSAREFGRHLRDLRGQLTQQAVARHSNIDQAALPRQRISAIENGAIPTAQQLRCYLHGCGKSGLLDELEPVRQRIEVAAGRVNGAVHPAPHMSRRRIRSCTAMSVLAAGTAAVVTGVAVTLFMDGKVLEGAASTGTPDCVEGQVCFWPEPNFIGQKITLPPDYYTGSKCLPLPFVARSVQNNSKERQRLFADTGCNSLETVVLQHLDRAPLPSVAVLSYQHS